MNFILSQIPFVDRIMHPEKYLWRAVTGKTFLAALDKLEQVDFYRMERIEFTWSDEKFNYLKFRFMQGYHYVRYVQGTVGYSELGIWTRTADLNGLLALTRTPTENGFAYVLMEDGSVLDGSFCHFPTGNFSLA